MCAVFGGVYCLRRTAICGVLDSEKKCCGVVDTTGQRLNSKWLVMETSYAAPQLLDRSIDARKISRGILITDCSLSPDSQLHMSLLNLPACEGQPQPITLLELSALSMTCPEGLYMVHLTCNATQDACSDLQPTVQRLFRAEEEPSPDDSRPRLLNAVYFNMADTTAVQLSGDVPDNVFMVSGPNADLDFDQAVIQARAVFEKICPGEEFLPRAPNPEDIIYDDGEGNQPKESGFEAAGEAEQLEDCATTQETPGKDGKLCSGSEKEEVRTVSGDGIASSDGTISGDGESHQEGKETGGDTESERAGKEPTRNSTSSQSKSSINED